MPDGCRIEGNRLDDCVSNEHILDGNGVDDNELDVNEIKARIEAGQVVGTFEVLKENC